MRRKRSKYKKLTSSLSVILILLLIIAISLVDKEKREDSVNGSKVNKEEIESIEFPYFLEDGKLEVASLFEFSGINPDCNGEMQENVASLSVKNLSDEYLISANIKAFLDDETEINFVITDIPAGQTVLVFSDQNIRLNSESVCVEIVSDAKFSNEISCMADKLSVETKETIVTVTNNSEETLSDLIVYCHCLLEGDFFGGLTYSYPIAEIEKGETYEFDASDCYMGQATVVRIEQSN